MGDRQYSSECIGGKDDRQYAIECTKGDIVKILRSPRSDRPYDGCERLLAQSMLEQIDKKLDIVLQRLRGSTRAEIPIFDQDTATEFSIDANEQDHPPIHKSFSPPSPVSRPSTIAGFFQPNICEVTNALEPNRPTPSSIPSAARHSFIRAMSGLSAQSEITAKSNKTSASTNSTDNTSYLSSFAAEFLSTGMRLSSGKANLRNKVHLILDDPEFNRVAGVFHIVMPLVVGASIAASFVQSVELDGKPVIDNTILRNVDVCFNAVFFLEVVIRFIVYPGRWGLLTNWDSAHFFFLVDAAASIPFGIFVMMGSWTAPENEYGKYSAARFLLLCFVPQVRLLKLLRYMETLHLLSYAFVLILEALPSMAFVIMMIIWFFASLVMLCEPPENVKSLAHAMWLAVLTMSTVGYGDVTPITVPGYIIVSLLVVCSILYTAMAFGLIGNIFTSVWKDRDRILLSRKMRIRLAQWGYKPQQIPQLFRKFDRAGKGELDVFTFREMIRALHLCLPEDRVNSLFLRFDSEGRGTIDAKDFIRHLFPNVFHDLYGARMQEEELQHRTTQNSSSELKLSYSGTLVPNEFESDLHTNMTRDSTAVAADDLDAFGSSRMLHKSISPSRSRDLASHCAPPRTPPASPVRTPITIDTPR